MNSDPLHCGLHNFLNTRGLLSLRNDSHLAARRRAPTVAAGSQGQTMRASDCPTVDTTEFLLAALDQASEAVVIVDSDLHVSHFNAAAEIDLGRRPRGYSRPSMQAVSGLMTCRPQFRNHDPARRRQPAPGSAIGLACRDRRPKQLHGLCSRHHRRGRTARTDRAAEPGGRQDQPRGRRHRSQSARSSIPTRAFSGMFGYSTEEAQGTAGARVARRAVNRPQDACDGCAAGSATDCGAEEEILAYDRNGDEIWVSATVKAFRNARGRIKYVFALLTDISENQAAAVAAATDHGRAGRRTSDHRDCRPALPARRSHRT